MVTGERQRERRQHVDDGVNVRGEQVATWFKPNRDHENRNRGTIDIDSPIVALGSGASDPRTMALIGARILVRNGVYKITRD